ncbi:hypothetical protein GALMADRAFT_917012 [Galerina marginata CBS 339.88]|uniref:Uncharacterized protein n=1 Tax=Galerina marginata (strain CBS 339.88) TaxID=685588 RepID=A0A067SF94_GALM3|nr:hypothetical protein GALMADRAFT_917012 [Galerina marginata CBS 339.88]
MRFHRRCSVNFAHSPLVHSRSPISTYLYSHSSSRTHSSPLSTASAATSHLAQRRLGTTLPAQSIINRACILYLTPSFSFGTSDTLFSFSFSVSSLTICGTVMRFPIIALYPRIRLSLHSRSSFTFLARFKLYKLYELKVGILSYTVPELALIADIFE